MNLSFFDKARGFVSEKATKRMLQLAGEGKTEELASLFRTISGFAPAKYHRESLALLADMIEADDPFFGFFKRIAREASPKCLEKLIQNLIVNFITLGRGNRIDNIAARVHAFGQPTDRTAFAGGIPSLKDGDRRSLPLVEIIPKNAQLGLVGIQLAFVFIFGQALA